MALVKQGELPFNRGNRKRFFRGRFNRARLEKGLRILPNLFTLGNAFFGFCSIIFAAHGDFIAAAYFILLGALMDTLDGRIARYTKFTSDLGMQLDSLCDSISFCLAPAALIYFWQLKRVGGLGFAVCALFMLAGLLRLARFNVTHSQQTILFLGTPTPIAGCFLATLLLNTNHIVLKSTLVTLLLLLVLSLALLMVSRIPFPSFKQLSRNMYALAGLSVGAFVITMGFTRVLLILFIGYFLFAFEEYFRAKIHHLKKGPFHE